MRTTNRSCMKVAFTRIYICEQLVRINKVNLNNCLMIDNRIFQTTVQKPCSYLSGYLGLAIKMMHTLTKWCKLVDTTCTYIYIYANFWITAKVVKNETAHCLRHWFWLLHDRSINAFCESGHFHKNECLQKMPCLE